MATMIRSTLQRCYATLLPKNSLSTSKWTRFYSSYPSHELVGLPALSPTMVQGNLAAWKKSEGDAISAGDVVCEIETDKAVVEYEAQDDIFLAKILVPEGTQDIAVGQPIMITVDCEKDIVAFSNYTIATESTLSTKKKDEKVDSKKDVPSSVTTSNPIKETTPSVSKVQSKPPQNHQVVEPKKDTPLKQPISQPSTQPTLSSELNERNWKTAVESSPLTNLLSKQQSKYAEAFGYSLSTPLKTV